MLSSLMSPFRREFSFIFIFTSMVLFAFSISSVTLASSHFKIEQGNFKDQQGRIIIFRGFNVAGDSKLPPYITITKPEQLDPLPGLGTNAIRLLFNWEAFEPSRDQYSEEYLLGYKNIVDWAYARGIYVIIDIHQDAFSRYNIEGCGDGFPIWTLPPKIERYQPKNDESCKNWSFKLLFDRDLKKSWSYFYSNTNNIREKYLEMLTTVARSFQGHPGVLGFDLINEPGGDEVKEISPLYQDAAKLLASIDPQFMIFTSPQILTGSGLSQSKLIRPEGNQIVYSPHYYNATMHTFGTWSSSAIKSALGKVKEKAKEWKTPFFLGEYGASAELGQAGPYMLELYRLLDENLISGTQWNYNVHWNPVTKDGWNQEDFSITDDQGKLRSNFQVRPYVQKIAGTPIEMKINFFSSKNFQLDFQWNHDPALGETEIFIPTSLTVGSGTKAIVLSHQQGECQVKAQENKVVCRVDVKGPVKLTIKSDEQ